MDLKIYAASLAAYSAGRLHGEWIDVSDVETMADEIAAMLATSPVKGEEYAIHDHSGWEHWTPDEYVSLDRLVAVSDLADDHGLPFLYWLGNLGGDYYLDDLGSIETEYQDAVCTSLEASDTQGRHYAGSMSDSLRMDFAYKASGIAELEESSAGYKYFDYEKWINDFECEGGTLIVFAGSDSDLLVAFS